jgi:Rieske Fe-S protein
MTALRPDAAPATDRRAFIRCSACSLVGLAALSLPACGGDGASPTDPARTTPKDTTHVTPTDTTRTKTGTGGAKFEITGQQIRVFVANVPELAAVPSAFLIEPALTLVTRSGANSFAAMTAVCTHEGCTVTNFQDQHLVCPCHGSTYDLQGAVVVGPAASPLAQFSASYDAAKSELLITKTN